LAVSISRTCFLRKLGCVLKTLLLIVAVWALLLMADGPELDFVERAWFLVRGFVGPILQSIWHFLGG
jgi:hypothetical protein